MKRWIIRQWNLRRREFFLWRQKQYAKCVNFYVTERTIWKLRRERPETGAKIVKNTRQLNRALTRRFDKIIKHREKRK